MTESNLRVRLTKQLIREGLLRCLQIKPIEKISISELCREAGVNRATFYHHYAMPRDILIEIGWEYARAIEEIFHARSQEAVDLQQCLTDCFLYLDAHRDTLRIILSANADRQIAESFTELFTWSWDHFADLRSRVGLDEEEYRLTIHSLGWAAYHFVRSWILEDIDKTPAQIGQLLYRLIQPLL